MPDKNSTKRFTAPPSEYITLLDTSNKLTERVVRKALQSLGLKAGSTIIDVPCGIGFHDIWMVQDNPGIEVTGVDISKEHLEIAEKNIKQAGVSEKIRYIQGEISELPFEKNTFDFLWCCNPAIPQYKTEEELLERIYTYIEGFKRVVRPAGTVAMAFWTSHKFLPGYPFVEAELAATQIPNTPSQVNGIAELHTLRAPYWLKQAGLSEIEAETFACDIRGPFPTEEEKNLVEFIDMFWGMAEDEVSSTTWETYKRITNPKDREFIFRQEEYSGIITYTVYKGTVS